MRPMLFQARQIEWGERASSLLTVRADAVRRRNQASLQKVAVGTEGALLGELGRISAHRGDRAGMRVLNVDVERTGARIFECRDRRIGRPDTVNREALQFVRILLEIGIAED